MMVRRQEEDQEGHGCHRQMMLLYSAYRRNIWVKKLSEDRDIWRM